MKKLNFNKPFKTIEGKDHETVKLGNLLGQAIEVLQETSVAAIVKYNKWANKAAQGEDLEVDEGDIITLKDIVSKSQVLTIPAKAQLITIIDS